jgi:chromosomal replication initiation ATPase DnaA
MLPLHNPESDHKNHREAENVAPSCAKISTNPEDPIFLEVVDGPSLTVLYGPTGSGKTRLFSYMEDFLRNHPECSVLRCCTSDLIDRLLDSLKHGTYGQFLSSLRAYRMFLIDNIWILGYRANTAREIFRIFRMLIHHGGAVVIASDLKPSVISSWSKEIGEMIGQSHIMEICYPLPCKMFKCKT